MYLSFDLDFDGEVCVVVTLKQHLLKVDREHIVFNAECEQGQYRVHVSALTAQSAHIGGHTEAG